MRFARSMEFLAMTHELVWTLSLSRDPKWPCIAKCTHLRVVGLQLEGGLILHKLRDVQFKPYIHIIMQFSVTAWNLECGAVGLCCVRRSWPVTARCWRMHTSTPNTRRQSTTVCGWTHRGPDSSTAPTRWSCHQLELAKTHCSTLRRFSAVSLEERWPCTLVSLETCVGVCVM